MTKEQKREYDRNRRINMTPEQRERRRASGRDYARRHPEIAHKWQVQNPALANACKLRWALKNYHVIQKWNAAHPDLVKEYKRKYHRNNPEMASRWAKAHPELNKAVKRKWEQENPGKLASIRHSRRAKKQTGSADTKTVAFCEFIRSQKRIPCYYCGKIISGKKAHIEHIIALSRTGNHSSDNLCCSCPTCNLRKGTKLPSELPFLDQPLLNL